MESWQVYITTCAWPSKACVPHLFRERRSALELRAFLVDVMNSKAFQLKLMAMKAAYHSASLANKFSHRM